MPPAEQHPPFSAGGFSIAGTGAGAGTGVALLLMFSSNFIILGFNDWLIDWCHLLDRLSSSILISEVSL